MRGGFIHSLRELVLDVRVRETLEQRALVLGQIDAMHRPERLDNLEHVRAQKGKHVRVGERVVDEDVVAQHRGVRERRVRRVEQAELHQLVRLHVGRQHHVIRHRQLPARPPRREGVLDDPLQEGLRDHRPLVDYAILGAEQLAVLVLRGGSDAVDHRVWKGDVPLHPRGEVGVDGRREVERHGAADGAVHGHVVARQDRERAEARAPSPLQNGADEAERGARLGEPTRPAPLVNVLLHQRRRAVERPVRAAVVALLSDGERHDPHARAAEPRQRSLGVGGHEDELEDRADDARRGGRVASQQERVQPVLLGEHLRHLFVPRHQADADDAPPLRRLHLSRVLLRQQHVRHVRQVRAVEASDSDVSDVRRRLARALRGQACRAACRADGGEIGGTEGESLPLWRRGLGEGVEGKAEPIAGRLVPECRLVCRVAGGGESVGEVGGRRAHSHLHLEQGAVLCYRGTDEVAGGLARSAARGDRRGRRMLRGRLLLHLERRQPLQPGASLRVGQPMDGGEARLAAGAARGAAPPVRVAAPELRRLIADLLQVLVARQVLRLE
mmetsp:Transcript_40588/g.131339  ORF Transcript_40588/g.131339 Transcript_40588/m.131339 type:complete len:557 (-) Transcript_40588:288-1958(-)